MIKALISLIVFFSHLWLVCWLLKDGDNTWMTVPLIGQAIVMFIITLYLFGEWAEKAGVHIPDKVLDELLP